MWLRHFAHKRRRPRFKRFRLRYYEFRQEDVVEICNWHHEEAHVIYLSHINAMISEINKPLREWSWIQADELMRRLRSVCASWLTIETPGITPRRLRPLA